MEIWSNHRGGSRVFKVLVLSGITFLFRWDNRFGKTTFKCIVTVYPKERIITIEDSAGRIAIVDKLIWCGWKQRKCWSPKVLPIAIRDLIKTALRMRPNRVIVGECRGARALDVLQAMNTGHDGSLSTGHANSAKIC